jgi:hypothetical protein
MYVSICKARSTPILHGYNLQQYHSKARNSVSILFSRSSFHSSTILFVFMSLDITSKRQAIAVFLIAELRSSVSCLFLQMYMILCTKLHLSSKVHYSHQTKNKRSLPGHHVILHSTKKNLSIYFVLIYRHPLLEDPYIIIDVGSTWNCASTVLLLLTIRNLKGQGSHQIS